MSAGAGYVGIENRKEIREDEHLSKVIYRINKKKGADRKREAALYKEPVKHLEYIRQPKRERELEYRKPKVRSKVEHIFYTVKWLLSGKWRTGDLRRTRRGCICCLRARTC